MNAPELTTDGAALLSTLTAPSRGLALVAARRRAAVALAVATAAALVTAAVVVPRVDYGSAAAAQVQNEDGREPTPFEREQAAATATKLGHIAGFAGALVLPSLLAAAGAAFLALGFRVAGTRPPYRATLAVVAHGMLPVWLGGLLAIPAVIARAPVQPAEAARLLPSSLAALLPPGAPPAAVALAASLDLFALWGLGLVALGMARVSGASRVRAFTVTIVLFLAYVALLKVVPAALLGGGAGPAPH